MPTYTTTSRVDDLLPSSLPATIDSDDKAQWVADASAMVDGMVGPKYPIQSSGQKFADITDSPATPAWIELCARWLAAYFGYLKLKEINKASKSVGMGATYYKLATEHLKQIREGEIDLYDSAGADLASTETMWSTTQNRDPAFARGRYEDGVLQGDAGSLDDFGL